MKNKDIKKLIAPLAAVFALGLGTAFGFTTEETGLVEEAIIAGGTAVVTLLGVFGVIKNNDK